MFENSDDYDFIPSGSSKLSSLFNNSLPRDDFNSSLTYTAPKQPKVKDEVDLNDSVKSKAQTSVVLAKVVLLWKLENKDYKPLGKHGLAVIGSQDLNLFEIIAYKEKNNILVRRLINSSLNFCVQKDLFSSFYDNDVQNWLVKFENIDDQNVFCQQLKSYGTNIINEKEETSQDTQKQTAATTSEGKVAPKQEILQNADENSDSSGSQKRANILSRMAKMGQQILPNQLIKNTSTDISDSELDDSRNDRKVPPRKFKRAIHSDKNIPKEETVAQQETEQQIVPLPSSNLNFPVQVPHTMVSPVLYNQPVAYDSGFNHYLVAQNTELKISLSQISTKLDSVLSGNNTSSSNAGDPHLKSKLKTLELKLENVQTELEEYREEYGRLQEEYKDLREERKNSKEKEEKCEIDNLKKEIAILNLDIREYKARASNCEKLEKELEKYKSDFWQQEEIVETQKQKLQELEEFHAENKDNKNLQDTIDNLNETVSKLESKLNYLEEYHKNAETDKQKRAEVNERITTTFSEKIKEHMNNMYQSIIANYDEDSSYTLRDVRVQVAKNLKGTTFKIIDDFQNIYKNPESGSSDE